MAYDLLTPGSMTLTVIPEMKFPPVEYITALWLLYLASWYCSMKTPSMGVSIDVLSPLAVWITASCTMEPGQWGRKGFLIWLKLSTLCQSVKVCLAAAITVLLCNYGWTTMVMPWIYMALETSEQFVKSHALQCCFHLLIYIVRGNTVDHAGQPWWNSFSNFIWN